jgi:membrane protease subunit HflC
MMQNKIYYMIFGAVAGIIFLAGSIFTVDQRQAAVIFQFGEAVRVIDKPGLSIKIPFIQNALNVTAEAKELTTADGERVIIDAFCKFKIVNPITFFTTVNNYQGAKLRLNKILESSMRKVIGKVVLGALLTDERSNLMLQIRDMVYKEAKSFGIDIVDVRILKTDLPPENSAAIYRRMQTEREKEARQIRAEGSEESAKIRSKADKETQIILANAYTDSQTTKGKGDAEAASLYNVAYSRDNI